MTKIDDGQHQGDKSTIHDDNPIYTLSTKILFFGVMIMIMMIMMMMMMMMMVMIMMVMMMMIAFELSEPTEDLAGVSFALEKVPKVIVMMMMMMMMIMGW